MLLAFIFGIVLALAHHLFYARLSGRQVPSGHYDIRIGKVSKQQFNTSVGTAFAFLVKSMLALAVTIAYAQVFWHAMRTSRRTLRLSEVDDAFSMLESLPIAWVFWLVMIPSVFTPATLSVQSAPPTPFPSHMVSVPQFDFVNFNFVDMYYNMEINNGHNYYYDGPSQLVQRVSGASATLGEILPITPPALNSSWTLEFWGPSLRCGHVAGQERDSILDNYGAGFIGYSNDSCTAPLPYYSWVSQGIGLPNILPFTEFNGSWYPTGYPSPNGTAQPLLLLIDDGTSLMDDIGICSKAYIDARGGWPGVFGNVTLIQCELFNSSYTAHFNYTNGIQNITALKTNASQDTVVVPQPETYLPYGPFETWTNATCPPGKPGISDDADCINKTNFQQLSYTGIADAFNNLIVGAGSPAAVTGSDIALDQTVLMYTNEMDFMYYDDTDGERTPPIIGTQCTPLRRSLGPLAPAMERLFENITISVLSNPYLQ
ncbi:hypothetical protein LTR36_007199 [Oleoguttula mirabilis]|uniref:Uncharacterized protein n=1 Tax=Oleoguttula mirabilis TaxID=1507867 RepID=A0AAV9JB21_9PEZI|nr:hypothetical protein LTR36_007199 [Oleoguttula mirabilis]